MTTRSDMDNMVQPFHLNGREVRGRLVRLGTIADDIISRHDLPPAPASLLGEALALSAMVGSALDFDGIFTMQTDGDGPAGLIVCDYRDRRDLRGYVRQKEVTDTKGAGGTQLGRGSMALTIDRDGDGDGDRERYQGVVELMGDDLPG